MKLVKILGSIVALMVVIAAGVVFYGLSNINSIVKEVVESVGSDTLKTEVRLEGVDIKLLEGSGTLGPMYIANYAGFSQKNLLSFEQITLDIDPASVTKDVIVIDEITIKGTKIIAEQKGLKTNLQSLMDALPKSEGTSSSETSSSTAPDIRLAVTKLNIIDNSISLATEDYGIHTLNMPKIVRSNLGSASKGLSPEELAKAIVKPLIESAKKQAENAIKDIAKKELEAKYGEQVEKEKEKLKEQLEDKLGDDAESKLKEFKKLF